LFGYFDPNGGNPRLVGSDATDIVSGRGSILSKDAVCSFSANTDASVGCIAVAGGVFNVSSNKSGAGSVLDMVFGVPTEAMRIDHTTKAVGIGSGATPARALHVVDAANGYQLRIQGPASGGAGAGLELSESTTPQVFFNVTSTGARITTAAGIPKLYLGAGLNDIMALDTATTRVAIGNTASPGYKLDIRSVGTSDGGRKSQVRIGDTDNAGAGIAFYSAGALIGTMNARNVTAAIEILNAAQTAAVSVGNTANVYFAGVLQVSDYAFASLPAAVARGFIYCTDCKSIGDGAAAGSVAVAGGTGVHLGSNGVTWRIMY
jgi:hypothetical protein